MSAWESAPGGVGTLPNWPEGMMLRAVCAKSRADAPIGCATHAATTSTPTITLTQRGIQLLSTLLLPGPSTVRLRNHIAPARAPAQTR
jgi:hypothetical protein